MSHSRILSEIESYYSAKFKEYGEEPRGVDWNSAESQILRFKQVMKIVEVEDNFSILDIGCGYGILVDYLRKMFKKYEYVGIDISKEMIAAARTRYTGDHSVRFHLSSKPSIFVDYGVASGIFNVRFKHNEDDWWAYILDTLDQLHATTLKGFAFNCLTKYSDLDKMRDHLYYADPCKLFDCCKNRYSRNVALLHDYGLYEFTILVRK